MNKPRVFEVAAILSVSVLINCPPAWAVLGGSPGVMEADSHPSTGQISTTPAPQYTVQELTTSDLVVREYVSSEGTVFAVSWSGRRPPKLATLLGTYFEEYEAASADAASKRSPMRGVMHVETPHLVVDSGGHMGAIWGKAYVPALFPPGVTKEAIQ